MTEREQSLQRQIDALLDDMEPLAAERDELKAQLAALTADHESAARAAEERIGKLRSALIGLSNATLDLRKTGCSDHARNLIEREADSQLDRAVAALAEVKP